MSGPNFVELYEAGGYFKMEPRPWKNAECYPHSRTVEFVLAAIKDKIASNATTQELVAYEKVILEFVGEAEHVSVEMWQDSDYATLEDALQDLGTYDFVARKRKEKK